MQRTKEDLIFRMRKNCKRRIALVINKNQSTDKYVGCSKEILMEWLEFKFDSTMTKENYGSSWEVDHVIPVAKFDLEDNEPEQMICFNWANLSPERRKYNRDKSDNFDKLQMQWHIYMLYEFCHMKKIALPIKIIDRMTKHLETLSLKSLDARLLNNREFPKALATILDKKLLKENSGNDRKQR